MPSVTHAYFLECAERIWRGRSWDHYGKLFRQITHGRDCRQCHRVFYSSDPRTKYCGRACARQARDLPGYKVHTCQWCNTEYYQADHRNAHCSRLCAQQHRRFNEKLAQEERRHAA